MKMYGVEVGTHDCKHKIFVNEETATPYGVAQTVDKVPDRSPGFSFILFSTFLIHFHRFTKKKIWLLTLFFKRFQVFPDIIIISGGSAYDDEKCR